MAKKLERQIYRLCVKRGWMVAVAESCTGGLIAHQLTNVPGSSQYFLGGVIAYSNTTKRRLLGVPAQTLQRHGAVSGPVVSAMARAVRRNLGAHAGLAVSGIAGPSGGTPAKPVGTVWIGIATARGARAFHHRFRGRRLVIKRRAARAALAHLHAMLHRD